MQKQIGVECRFAVDGTVDVGRIYLDGSWQPVGQGRQWVDGNGRHVLVLLQEDEPREILLLPKSMTWVLLPVGSGRTGVV